MTTDSSKRKQQWIAVGALAAAGLFAMWYTSPGGGGPSATERAADCRKDIQCWGDEYVNEAGVYCQSQIETQGRFGHRWTDGIAEPKISRFRWLDQAAGTLTYIGDKIEFQNGFGAWENYVYECDFDPSDNTVLAVRVSPGRL